MNNNTNAAIVCVIISALLLTIFAASYATYSSNNELKYTVYSNFREHGRMLKIYCDEAVYSINNGNYNDAILFVDRITELMQEYHYNGIELLGADYSKLYAVFHQFLPSFHNSMLAIRASLLAGNVTQSQVEFLADCSEAFFHIYKNTPESSWSGYYITDFDGIIIALGRLVG